MRRANVAVAADPRVGGARHHADAPTAGLDSGLRHGGESAQAGQPQQKASSHRRTTPYCCQVSAGSGSGDGGSLVHTKARIWTPGLETVSAPAAAPAT